MDSEAIMAIVALGIPFVASILSAIFPDKASLFMKIVNIAAVNFGNAKNDPRVNE